MADIEQMFYGFHVDEKDRNYLRFFWHKDNDLEKELIEFRMRVHVFGNTPSPAIASYGLRKCVEHLPSRNIVKEYVSRNLYVDDGLETFENEDDAVNVLKQTQKVLQNEGQLRLHKIASNSEMVMRSFDTDDVAKDLRSLDFREDAPIQRSLGMCLDVKTDTFSYKLSVDEKPITRRGILSMIKSLYDPLGFIAPVVLQGRILMRDIITETTNWDLPLSKENKSRRLNWKQSLQPLEQLTMARQFVPTSYKSAKNKFTSSRTHQKRQ